MPSILTSDPHYIINNSQKALKLLQEHKILPTPQNYQLWYTYSGDYDFSLSRFVDKLIINNTPIDDQVSEKLYEKFFSIEDEKKAVNETSDSFKNEIRKIMEILKDVNQDNTSHTESINNQIDKLEVFEGTDELKEIIKLVVQDVNVINAQTQKLEKQLEETSETIAELNTNLENARIESRTDALTNIGNRKSFDEKITNFTNLSNPINESFCLIICDIDFFKKFNDAYGHQIGDQVLKVVAHVLKTTTEKYGTAYRYGGEEFVILIPSVKLNDAKILTECIRQAISKKSIKNKKTGEDFGKITMSFGIAEYRNGEISEALVQRADQALYLAKENGRNRVQLETDIQCSNLKCAS